MSIAITCKLPLGSTSTQVAMMVMKEGLKLALIGLFLGLATALCLTPLLQNQLYRVSPRDPMLFALLSLILFLAAVMTCWIPAQRAAQIDPMHALRYE